MARHYKELNSQKGINRQSNQELNPKQVNAIKTQYGGRPMTKQWWKQD